MLIVNQYLQVSRDVNSELLLPGLMATCVAVLKCAGRGW